MNFLINERERLQSAIQAIDTLIKIYPQTEKEVVKEVRKEKMDGQEKEFKPNWISWIIEAIGKGHREVSEMWDYFMEQGYVIPQYKSRLYPALGQMRRKKQIVQKGFKYYLPEEKA